MYRHIVLFRVHDDVGADRVDDALRQLGTLGTLPGVLDWRIERSLDGRKGTVLVEDATFVDRAAFDAFRSHPTHGRVAAQLAEIADWWIGDYEAD